MKKSKLLLSFAIALCSVGVLSSGGMEVKKVEAASPTSTLTIDKNNKLQQNGGTTSTDDSKKWNYTGMTFIGTDYSNGVQIGKSDSPTKSFSVTSIDYLEYNIESITVKSRIAKDGTAKLKVSIGDNHLGDNEYTSLTTTLKGYTFKNDNSYQGTISIDWTNTEKAFYLKSITVVYSESVGTKYAVSFNTDGGTPITDKYVLEGEKVIRPEVDPEKEGYKFGGWYSDSSCTIAFDFESVINENTTIYAKWIKKTITELFVDNTDVKGALSFGFNSLKAESVVLNSAAFGSPAAYTDITDKTIDKISFNANMTTKSGSTAMQVRKDSSFICNSSSTPFADGIKKIVIKWNSDTTSNRTINIYGSNSAFNASVDGEEGRNEDKIASVTYDSSKPVSEIIVTRDNVNFIFMDFSGGAMYLEEITLIASEFQLYGVSNMSLNFKTDFDFTDKTQGTDFTEAGMMFIKGSDVSATYSKTTAEALPEGAIIATQTNYAKEFIVRLEDIPVSDWETKVTVVPYILIDGTYYFGTASATNVIEVAGAYSSSEATITLSDASVVNVKDVAAEIAVYYNANKNSLGE